MVAINQISTLAASLALVALVAEAAPAPRTESRDVLPNLGRRMERVNLRSTSPPLPAGVKTAERRSMYPAQKPFTRLNKRSEAGSKRSPEPRHNRGRHGNDHDHDHAHIHEHIHSHDHDHDHGRHGRHGKKGKKYSSKDKAHHSKHWAKHHGLARREGEESLEERNLIEIGDTYDMSGRKHGKKHHADDDLISVLVGRDGLVTREARHSDHSEHWYKHHKGDRHRSDRDHDHDHEHVHEHVHSHRRSLSMSRERDVKEAPKLEARSRSSRPFRYHPRNVEERGLLGDVVKPLLAPLNAIPGFITISDLLFSDGGLVKKLGGLVLHATPAGTPAGAKSLAADTTAFNYSLMASKAERTQVWLMATDVNATEAATPEAPAPSAFSNDTTTVRVALPIIDDKGMPVLYCATFDKAPPSALQLQPCADDASEASPEAAAAPTSQRFSYTSSTGSLAPIYMAAADASSSSTDLPSSSSASAESTSMSSSVEASATPTEVIAARAVNKPPSYFRVFAPKARDEPSATDAASSSATPTPTADATSTSAAAPAPTASANAGKVSLKFTPAGAAPKQLAVSVSSDAMPDEEDVEEAVPAPAEPVVDSAEVAAEPITDAAPDATAAAAPAEALPTDAAPVDAAAPVEESADDAAEMITGALDRTAVVDNAPAPAEASEPAAEPAPEATPAPEALNLAVQATPTSAGAAPTNTCACITE